MTFYAKNPSTTGTYRFSYDWYGINGDTNTHSLECSSTDTSDNPATITVVNTKLPLHSSSVPG
jgi:hypothetical protein